MSVLPAPVAVSLGDVDRDDIPRVGGKSANLGAMVRAGLPVPDGFCVPAQTYRAVVDVISDTILTTLVGLDSEDTAALESASRAIRQQIEALLLPDEIADGIVAAYRALAETIGEAQPGVAVRSSATAEDLPDSSFAGQQDTFLNVRGEAALLDAVRRCWSSLWTPRAIAYRQRNDYAHDQVAIAVVVQQMVDSEVSGVLFTADPVSGSRVRMVINGSWGLGEAIVSGMVAPDGWVLDRSGQVIEQEIGSKTQMIVYAPDGGTVVQNVPPERRAQPSLSTDDLRRLVDLGRRVEQHFGTPQDIEWALHHGRLYLLQSRPITTLFPLPEPRPGDDARHFYLSVNALQGVMEPITPLGIDLFREVAHVLQIGTGLPTSTPDGKPRLVEAAGRMYVDATAALRHPVGRVMIQLPFRVIDPTSARLFPQILSEPDLTVQPASRLRIARAVARTVWRCRFMLRRVARTFRAPQGARGIAEAQIVDRLDRMARLVERPMSLGERRVMVRTILLGVGKTMVTVMPPTLAPGMLSFYLVEQLASRWKLPPAELVALRQGLRDNPTTEMDLALWQLSRTIKADRAAAAQWARASDRDLAAAYAAGQLAPVAQRGLAEFLDRYGHRGVREIDVGMPRWRETPEYIINALHNYLLMDDPTLAPDRRFAELERIAEATRLDLSRQVRSQPRGRLKAAVLSLLTSRMRALLGLREAPKFWGVRMIALLRRNFQLAGDDLVRRGLLDDRNDVFFLRLKELDQAAWGSIPPLRDIVAARRAEYDRELQRQQFPRVLTSDGESIVLRRADGEADEPGGIGVSQGIYEGRVRVIRDPHGARLEPGEILVAPSTDPAWTPLFLTAGGLIMEAGGMLSHGSVVAREYGIPAVVGVAGATSRLVTGQMVRIDGMLGTIEMIDPA